MKYTLYDLLYVKGVSEPLRAAVQAQMAKLEATVETQNRLLDAKRKDHEIIQEKNNALRARLKAVESELQSWKDVAKRFSNEADALRTHLSFAKDELNQLRAKVEEMEKQEPVAWMSSRNGFIVKDNKNHDYNMPLYLAPGVKGE